MTTRYRKEKYIEQRLINGKWIFRVRIRGVCDKTFSELEYGSAKRAFDTAIIFRDNKISDRRLNLITEDVNKSARDVLLESFDLFPIRERSKRVYLYSFDKHMKDFNKPISNLSKVDIMMSLNKALYDGQGALNTMMLVWRKIVKTAIIKGYIVKDITLGITTPKTTKTREKREVITSREQIDEVLGKVGKNTVQNKSYCMAVEFMYYLGLRPCEAFALTKSDIKDGFVYVTKEVGSDITDSSDYWDNSKVTNARTCKTSSSVRKIPMPKELSDKLLDYDVEGELLFPSSKGGYLTSQGFTDILKRRKISNFNLYMLRHTLASDLVAKNVDDRTIIEVLGHKNINMSVYYARSDDDRKKDALNNR